MCAVANGKGPLLNLQGVVNTSGALVVVAQAVSGSLGPKSSLANKVCAVDSSNRLIVTFG